MADTVDRYAKFKIDKTSKQPQFLEDDTGLFLTFLDKLLEGSLEDCDSYFSNIDAGDVAELRGLWIPNLTIEAEKPFFSIFNKVLFVRCRFLGTVTIQEGEEASRLSEIAFENRCRFYGVLNSVVEEIPLCFDRCLFLETSFLKIQKSRNIEIGNSIFCGKVLFENVFLHETDTKHWSIYATSFFRNVEFKSCSLEGADFFRIHLSALTARECSFSETYFNHIVWPKPEKIVSDRDSLRQIKYALHEHGNYLDANLFHSLEMDAYKDELCKTKFFDRFEDKAVFWLSYAVSKFSQSWLLPLFWFFVVGFGFFLFFDTAYQGLLSGSFCDRFWQFVNPLSDVISEKAAIYKGAYSFWFLHKLISGFIVYHFIVALRRKTRNI